MHWLEILEQLRKEQSKEYERPYLELPIPYYEEPRYEYDIPKTEEPSSRVVIIDMFEEN